MLVDSAQRRLLPALFARTAVLHDGAKQIVAVPEDISLDADPVPVDALGRIASAIDRGGRILDDDAGRRAFQRRQRGIGLGFSVGSGSKGHTPEGIQTAGSGKQRFVMIS